MTNPWFTHDYPWFFSRVRPPKITYFLITFWWVFCCGIGAKFKVFTNSSKIQLVGCRLLPSNLEWLGTMRENETRSGISYRMSILKWGILIFDECRYTVFSDVVSVYISSHGTWSIYIMGWGHLGWTDLVRQRLRYPWWYLGMSPAPKQTGASQSWSCETLARGMEHVCDGLAYEASEEERLLKELQDSEPSFCKPIGF